jgi:hypothetical protein
MGDEKKREAQAQLKLHFRAGLKHISCAGQVDVNNMDLGDLGKFEIFGMTEHGYVMRCTKCQTEVLFEPEITKVKGGEEGERCESISEGGGIEVPPGKEGGYRN